MTLSERLVRLNRIQQGRLFKIIASCVVIALGIAAIVSYVVAVEAAPPAFPEAALTTPPPTESGEQAAAPIDEATSRVINSILAAKQDPTSFAVGVAAAVGLALAVIWLGLGLTYLGLGVAAAAVVFVVAFFQLGRDTAPLIIGLVALTAAFTALMRLLALLLSGPGPVFAIARNVLAEAVRMKISLVFIVMLIFGLAALPGLLSVDQPLRYRVQSFLQYGTGGAYWLIAVLTLVFSASTVAFEQRDKVIWQTMTKPVGAWQYILGKWLGVVGLCAVLLTVSGTGVFLFTEHLRTQPALDERNAYENISGQGISEDRLILETQVLTARVARPAQPLQVDPQQFEKNIQQVVENELASLGELSDDPEVQRQRREGLANKIRGDIQKNLQIAYRSIAGQSEGGMAGFQNYKFTGLQAASKSNRPIILRYKINAGSNQPDQLYKVTFAFQNSMPEVEEVALGHFQTIPLLPTVIDKNGMVEVQIINGYPVEGGVIPNPETISFPPDGLEVSYSSGGYRANFARVLGVLWVKLAFLAMLGICAATFLSFPVACLVAFTVFLSAEGATFLLASLENYSTEDTQGNSIFYKVVINYMAMGIGNIFKIYSDLRPTGRLVDGVRLSWVSVAVGTVVLAIWTAILYVVAVIIFRMRELATYSGQ